MREIITRIKKRIGDIAFHGRHKAMILIGTDRKDTINSGYGETGQNDVDSAVIDLVVGYGSGSINPDYKTDKSRIYIAEKTDPDIYFGIEKGSEVTEEPAIIQTSDNVYLKARKKIKILNDNVSIIVEGNEITIEATDKVTIKSGQSSVVLNKDGQVSVGTGSAQEDYLALEGKTRNAFNNLILKLNALSLPVAGTTAKVPPGTFTPITNTLGTSKVKAD